METFSKHKSDFEKPLLKTMECLSTVLPKKTPILNLACQAWQDLTPSTMSLRTSLKFTSSISPAFRWPSDVPGIYIARTDV